jgi:hypothetical protein
MKYDDEIREVEARLIRERQALAVQAEDLSATAREAAASPKGLLIALAVGFALGELTAPRKRSRHRKRDESQAVETTKKLGLGGLIGSALMAYARTHYGSPWALARHAWNYYAASQRTRRAAMQRSTGYEPVTPAAVPPAPVVTPAPAAAASSGYPHIQTGSERHATS